MSVALGLDRTGNELILKRVGVVRAFGGVA